jgi:hypothetical protein
MTTKYKTEQQLNAESFEELSRETPFTNLNPGSRTRVHHEIANRRIAELWNKLKFDTAMGQLSNSSGYFLDILGVGRGIVRRTATTAVVYKEDKNIKFYVISGTLKSQLGSSSIPAGTVVQNNEGTIQFRTTESAPLNDVDTEVYVSATALGAGTQYRIGRGILQNHSLGSADVFVTNVRDITSGDDIEQDNNYRFRIANNRAIHETSNLVAVRAAMLPVPGVADVVLKEYPGYIDGLIIPSGNFVPDSIVRACQFLGNRTKGGGIKLYCRGPSMVPYELYVQASLTRETPASQAPQVKQYIKRAVLDYLDSITLGGEMVVRELSARIQQADQRIHDHRLVCLMIRRKPQLIRNYQLRQDELFTPDPESENPIAVTIV